MVVMEGKRVGGRKEEIGRELIGRVEIYFFCMYLERMGVLHS